MVNLKTIAKILYKNLLQKTFAKNFAKNLCLQNPAPKFPSIWQNVQYKRYFDG